MKINIEASKLHKKLSESRDIIPSKSIGLADKVSTHVYISALKNGEIEFIASDKEINLISKETIDPETESVEVPGTITLPAKKLLELAALLPKEVLTIEAKDNVAHINTGNKNNEVTFSCTDGSSYSKVRVGTPAHIINLEQEILKKLVETTAFSVSVSTGMAALLCLYFEVTDKKISVVGADSPRMAIAEYEFSNKDEVLKLAPGFEVSEDNPITFLVQKKCVDNLLKGHLSNTSENVEIALYENEDQKLNKVSFSTSKVSIITTLLNASYPPYRNVIPKEHATLAVVNKKDLLTAVRISKAVMEERNAIKLGFKAGKLIVETEVQPDKSVTSKQELVGEVTGTEVDIYVNINYVYELLTRIPDHSGDQTKIKIGLSNGTPDSVFQFFELEPKQVESTYIVMPISK